MDGGEVNLYRIFQFLFVCLLFFMILHSYFNWGEYLSGSCIVMLCGLLFFNFLLENILDYERRE